MRPPRIPAALAALAALAVAALAAAACHDLPSLGTCGNGITEETNGEACDEQGDTDTCTSTCELKCIATDPPASYVSVGPPGGRRDAPAVFCPDEEFRCGTDNICRAPSGAFEPLASPQPFNIGGSPVIGDVDNDGLLDLVGTNATTIYIRFASTAGAPLGELLVQDAPSSDAPLVIFDRQLAADPPRFGLAIAIPTEGVALLGSNGERFAPELDLEIPITTGTRGLVVRDPDSTLGDVVVAVANRSADEAIRLQRVQVDNPSRTEPPSVPMQALPPCVGSEPGAWSTVDVKAAPDRRSFVVITQHDPLGDPAQPWHLCRYTQVAGAWSVAQQELSSGGPSSAVLANVDADACLELAVRGGGAAGIDVIDAVAPGCGFAAVRAPLRLVDAGMGLGLLAAGPIAGADAADELVLQGGIYRACTGPAECGAEPIGTFLRIARPTQVPWNAAVLTDLNGDGELDVVAGRDLEHDLDVARGGAAPNVYRVTTAGLTMSLAAGDFDGDRLGDVAIVERSPPGDRLLVTFGTRDGIVDPPRVMSAPRSQLVLDRLESIPWLRAAAGTDGVDDLLVADVGGASPRVGLVVGDAARLLTTPRFPPQVVGAPLHSLGAGRFTTDDGSAEILAIPSPTMGKALLYNTNPMVERWTGEVPIPAGIGPPPLAPLRDDRGGHRLAARVISAQGSPLPQFVVFSVRGGLAMCGAATARPPIDLRGVDIDRDGVDEVVVYHEDGGRRIQVFRVDDAPGGCMLVEVHADLVAGCADVADAGAGLIAICRSEPGPGPGPANEVHAFRRTATGFARSSAGAIANLQGNGHFVAASDYDGDGVPDVAIGVRRVDEVAVQLMRQCPAHDTRGCLRLEPAGP